jgi:alpha-mannosidase
MFVLSEAQALSRHWLDRFRAECEFAQGLAALPTLKDQAAGWGPLLDRAKAAVALAAGESPAKVMQAVQSAERDLASIATVAKTFTISCAGHAHIDMNWLWGWQETVAVTIDTFSTVLALMDEFPTFCFTQSQASVYQIAREYHPELFARIQARVKEGRWEIAASHWVEGDKNLASGESLCRHLLYTRRFMQEHFSLTPEDITVDWSPDTFGHAHTLPMIDSRGGVKHYYMCRSGDSNRPPVFWWKSPDGSRVLVNREIQWYNSEIRPHVVNKLLEFSTKTGSREWMQVYGVGDHGGGPTRRDLRCLLDMDTWPVFPTFRFSTVKRFFTALEQLPNLPVLDQELNFEFSGCYTSQSSIKRANRIGENLMSEADAFSALAHAAIGKAVPGKQLRETWCDVLFSHFHDILPGSGVRQTREFNSGMLQKIQASAGQIRTQSLRALAAGIDTSCGGRYAAAPTHHLPEHESTSMGGGPGKAFNDVSSASVVVDGPRAAVVFNPTAWKREEIVRATIWDLDTGPNPRPMKDRSYVARLPDGSVTVAQRVGEGHYWGHTFVELAFPAQVGALGWSTQVIEEGAHPAGPSHCWGRKDSESGVNSPFGRLELENDLVKVCFDRKSGGITSLVLKATGEEFADPQNPLGVLEYVLERPVGMSAWILGDVQSRRSDLEVEAVDLLSWGPHVAQVQVKVKVTADSRFTVIYELHAGSPAVVVAVDGTWLERGRNDIGIPRLAMRFPFAMSAPTARYEIPYGSIERSEVAGREVPALRWATISGTSAGKPISCSVLNDCKYGHSLDGSMLRINIVRSSYEPDPLPEVGQQQVRFSILPVHGATSVADAIRAGAAFNHPMHAVVAPVKKGGLGAVKQMITCDAANVIVTQAKWAEDGSGLVLRLLETSGKAATAVVTLDLDVLGKALRASETDVLERHQKGAAVRLKEQTLEVDLAAHGLSTVAITFAKRA